MRHLIILLVTLGLLAGEALAGANAWSIANLYPDRPGNNISIITPTTSTGDTESPTVGTANCGSLMIFVYGADITGYVQGCKASQVLGAGIDVEECGDVNLSSLNGASTTFVQIDGGVPAYLRLRGVTGSDSSQSFQVTCGP